MNNKQALIALNKINGIGPRTLLKLHKHFDSYAKILNLTRNELKDVGLNDKLIDLIFYIDGSFIKEDMEFINHENNHIVTWDDPQYPPLLKEIFDPPAVIYGQGKIDLLQNTNIAIVGSRNPTPSGAEIAYNFASELALSGVTIVSGLAIGVDERAHQGTLDSKGSTIAVLGSGLKQIYPLRNKKLAQNIICNGLIISEFSLNSRPQALHFPRRNRIISGLSLSILVIEAAVKSGSLITARFGLEQNREVMAVPGSIYNQQAKGCHQLLKEGAKLITSIEDILQELPKNPCKNRENDKLLLANEQKNLVKFIGFEHTPIDIIQKRSQMPLEKIISELANLELSGIVCKVAGGYMRIK